MPMRSKLFNGISDIHMESKKINGVSMMTEPAGGVSCILPDEMWTGDI